MNRKRQASNVLTRQLGELELQVMECLWQQPGLDARQVLEQLAGSRSGSQSLSTIQSTLERMVKKELLTRSKRGHAYDYEPAITRPLLLARMMGDVIQLLHDGRLETILSSFIDVAARLDDDSLARLEQLIERRKAAAGGKPTEAETPDGGDHGTA